MLGKTSLAPIGSYAFPPVLQSFINKDSPSYVPPASDKAALITDSVGAPPQSSYFFPPTFFTRSSSSGSKSESFLGFSRGQRLFYFGISAICASLFFSFALIFIPLLATPAGLRKFVIMYIIGNVALMFTFAFAFGPWTYMKRLVTRDRLPSTLVYWGSLFLGIYGVVWWRSTLCALLAIGIQVGLGLWQLQQFIWGGTKLFSLFSRLSSLRPGGISASTLPV